MRFVLEQVMNPCDCHRNSNVGHRRLVVVITSKLRATQNLVIAIHFATQRCHNLVIVSSSYVTAIETVSWIIEKVVTVIESKLHATQTFVNVLEIATYRFQELVTVQSALDHVMGP